MELTGKTAIVTGASGILGGEIAIGLAKAGCNVVLHYNKHAQNVERIAGKVGELGRRAVVVQADLCGVPHRQSQGDGGGYGGATSAGAGGLHEVWDAIMGACRQLSAPQILVNSAALFGRTPVGKIDREQAMRIMELDLLVPILLIQEFAEFLNQSSVVSRQSSAREEKEPIGKIINIVDIGGERVWKEYSVYCAAKAGLIAATKVLAKELAPAITVNAVAPGMVTWVDGIDEAGKKRQLGFIPAGRIARPEEIAATVVFLLQNDYITGQVINVDGGRSV